MIIPGRRQSGPQKLSQTVFPIAKKDFDHHNTHFGDQ